MNTVFGHLHYISKWKVSSKFYVINFLQFQRKLLVMSRFSFNFQLQNLDLEKLCAELYSQKYREKKAGGDKQAEKKKLEGLLKKFCIVSLLAFFVCQGCLSNTPEYTLEPTHLLCRRPNIAVMWQYPVVLRAWLVSPQLFPLLFLRGWRKRKWQVGQTARFSKTRRFPRPRC